MSALLTNSSTLDSEFGPLDYAERFRFIRGHWDGEAVATTSAGAQSAVMLDLIHRYAPEIPVVFIDTGYLFPETYDFFEELQERFPLDYRIYAPQVTAARLERIKGKLWEKGDEGLVEYGKLTKVEPMNRALREIGSAVWISGLRRAHSEERGQRRFIEQQGETTKVFPILDWSDDDIASYMAIHELPLHPLVRKGYVSIGDWHSTQKLEEGMSVEETRFNGAKRECGLHEMSGDADWQI